MDGDVIFFGGGGECKRMVLPNGDFGAAEENILSCAGFGVFLLDLNLEHVAGVLDDFRDVSLVLPTHFTCYSFHQVDVAAIHPVLPEDADGGSTKTDTEWCGVWLNHAERSVDRPEYEEDDEEVVGVPEAFEVSSSVLLI